MTSLEGAASAASAVDLPIRSRADFQQAVRTAMHEAATAGCRELWFCDVDFAGWPLGERGVVDDLARWVDTRRRLHLLAANFDAVARLHPRWTQWRRGWSHVVDCRSNTEIEPGRIPTLLLAPGHFGLVLHDRSTCRGQLVRDAAWLARARERLDAVLQQSAEAFPVGVTGL